MASSSLSLVPQHPEWGPPTPPRRQVLWEKESRKCHWCGTPTQISWNNLSTDATIDHIVPRSHGGTDDASNVVSACNGCNGRRDYEWKKRLPEGHLLGKWPIKTKLQKAMHIPRKMQTEDILRDQRDQALREIATLRKENKVLKSETLAQANELKLFHKIVEDQEKDLKSMTVWKLLRKRIAAWISP